MTHTPGPWEIRRVGIAKDLPVVTSAEHDVCEMRYNTNGRLRLENNARLIAAAPELLAALKAIMHTLDYARDNCKPRGAVGRFLFEVKGGCGEHGDLFNARSAIARVEAE